MTGVTSELMYDVLKAVQTELATHGHMLRDINAEVRAIRMQLAGQMQHDVIQDAAIAELRVRVDRIERRLDLVD